MPPASFSKLRDRLIYFFPPFHTLDNTPTVMFSHEIYCLQEYNHIYDFWIFWPCHSGRHNSLLIIELVLAFQNVCTKSTRVFLNISIQYYGKIFQETQHQKMMRVCEHIHIRINTVQNRESNFIARSRFEKTNMRSERRLKTRA